MRLDVDTWGGEASRESILDKCEEHQVGQSGQSRMGRAGGVETRDLRVGCLWITMWTLTPTLRWEPLGSLGKRSNIIGLAIKKARPGWVLWTGYSGWRTRKEPPVKRIKLLAEITSTERMLLISLWTEAQSTTSDLGIILWPGCSFCHLTTLSPPMPSCRWQFSHSQQLQKLPTFVCIPR